MRIDARMTMINQNQVRRMTRMAAYEDTEGGKDARITQYFRVDYLTKQALITFVCATAAFLILFGAYVIYHFDDVIDRIYNSNLQGFLVRVLLQYAAFVGILIGITLVVYGARYNKARRRQNGLRKDIFQLALRYRRR